MLTIGRLIIKGLFGAIVGFSRLSGSIILIANSVDLPIITLYCGVAYFDL